MRTEILAFLFDINFEVNMVIQSGKAFQASSYRKNKSPGSQVECYAKRSARRATLAARFIEQRLVIASKDARLLNINYDHAWSTHR